MSTYTLSAAVESALDIRKSRFLGVVMPVEDREAAMFALKDLRARHPGATHVCWALLAGGQSGMSDDGEPSGTAGRPMLEVLRHHELDGVLAAVVRYYGGVKLGAGGLVRAYSDAVATALKHAQRVEKVMRVDLVIELDYPDEARVRRWIEQEQHGLVACVHAAIVTMTVRVPLSAAAATGDAVRELTQGRARVVAAPA